MKRKPKLPLIFSDKAINDLVRCYLFLQRMDVSQPEKRIREIKQAARLIVHSPKLYPVEERHPISGIEFRRKCVGQFAIVYAYLEPTTSLPNGAISIRRIRHGGEVDVFFGVEEARSASAGVSRGLSTRMHFVAEATL
jgi:plasmid stabilization system protein ParE